MMPMGDAAWRAAVAPDADAPSVLAALRAVPGVTDAVVADGVALVCFDPATPPDRARVRHCLAGISRVAKIPSREHTICARYDGEDIDYVAELCAATVDDVIRWHAEVTYTVECVGFLPGFGYLGRLHPTLALVPRRASPRARVPSYAIGIAAGRTGVYPVTSPGGWQLLGTAVDFVAFDPTRGATLALGDRVRFVPV